MAGKVKGAKTGKSAKKAVKNATKKATTKAAKTVMRKGVAMKKAKADKGTLLSGGNPQIAKGYGDPPVQAYIAAIPGWKQDVARRVDAIVTKAVPGARKAVKWNSPLYGTADEDQGWFLGLHMYTNYVKVAFFNGASLRPLPTGESTQKTVRYLDIREGDTLDERQLAMWARQAAELPGQRM